MQRHLCLMESSFGPTDNTPQTYKPYLYYVDSSVIQTINFVPFGVKLKEVKSLYYCLLM